MQERKAWTADSVIHLRTGETLTAEIDGSPAALERAAELFEDYRNMVLLHITDDTQAATLLKNDRVRFTLYGRVITAQIIKRADNPANVQNDFWAQCLTAKDQ